MVRKAPNLRPEFVLQNPQVNGRNLESSIRKPFDIMLTWRDVFQTFEWEKAFPYPDAALRQMNDSLALSR